MLTKVVVIVIFLVILYCLGSAFYYTFRQRAASREAAKALTWRVLLSLILMLILIAGYYLGWITPHPLLLNS